MFVRGLIGGAFSIRQRKGKNKRHWSVTADKDLRKKVPQKDIFAANFLLKNQTPTTEDL